MNSENRQQIIKYFLKKGYQLDGGAVDLLEGNADKIDDIVNNIESSVEPTTTITKEDLKKAMWKSPPEIKVLFGSRSYGGKTVTTANVLNEIQQNYEILRAAIEFRPGLDNLTLVSKRGSLQQFSIIVMVNDIDRENQRLTVEDTTGTLNIHAENPKLLEDVGLDDTVGIKCKVVGDDIKAENIIFPDINIKKNVQRTQDEINCYFVWIPHTNVSTDKNTLYTKYERIAKQADGRDVFVLLGEGLEKEEAKTPSLPVEKSTKLLIGAEQHNTTNLKLPALFKIENVTICLANYTSDNGEQEIKKMLKKRRIYAKYETDSFWKEQDTLLTEPDIIVAMGKGKENVTNYRGTTILCMGAETPSIWKTNLRTRENIKVVVP